MKVTRPETTAVSASRSESPIKRPPQASRTESRCWRPSRESKSADSHAFADGSFGKGWPGTTPKVAAVGIGAARAAEMEAAAPDDEGLVEEGNSPGGRFGLALLMVDRQGNGEIVEWLGRGRRTGDFPGLERLANAERLDVVTNLVLTD
jgi:hypothetical protein